MIWRRSFAIVRGPMHRPTRKHKHLLAKIERKQAKDRPRGKKAKRWTKWAEAYKGLAQES